MKQKILTFHRDEEDHWVADLECGHKQHVRHDPPFHPRQWVTDQKQREQQKGEKLDCKRCDEVGRVVATAVLNVALEALEEAQIDSAAAAMCREGQIELAIDYLNSLDLDKISQDSIAKATSRFGTLE